MQTMYRYNRPNRYLFKNKEEEKKKEKINKINFPKIITVSKIIYKTICQTLKIVTSKMLNKIILCLRQNI